MDADDFDGAAFAVALGERLRTVRTALGLSLQAVAAASGHAFRASVLGAYERGERQVSVLRLQQLARCYGMTVDQLLPQTDAAYITIDLRDDRPARPDASESLIEAIVRARRPSHDFRVRLGDQTVLAAMASVVTPSAVPDTVATELG